MGFVQRIVNFQKHGISFAEAVETFSDPHGFQLRDLQHSDVEARFFWVGKSESGKILTTRNIIRIFGSASWRKLGRLYRERAQNE